MNFEIGAISNIDEFLIFIMRKRNIPGAACQCKRGHLSFFNEGSVRAKYLNAIGAAVTNIDQPVVGWLGTVNRPDKLLW